MKKYLIPSLILVIPFLLAVFSVANAIGGGMGTINMLNQLRSTTTPFEAVTTNTPGKDLYMPFGNATTSNFSAINAIRASYFSATSTSATTSLQKTKITGAIDLLGEYFTNFTTYVRSLFIGGNHITITSGSIAVDDDFLLNTGDTATGDYIFDSGTLVIDSASNMVGVGTLTPAVDLDVSGTVRATKSIILGTNVEALTGNKTLVAGVDEMYQWLDANGGYRTITIDTASAKKGDRFVIRNNSIYSVGYYLFVVQGATILDYIYSGRTATYIFDGTNWVSGENGSGGYDTYSKYNTMIGAYANGNLSGVAVGYNAQGYSSGAAIGSLAKGYINGAAVGYAAAGHTNGAALGKSSNAYQDGVAIGYASSGYQRGVSLGRSSKAQYSGVSVGYGAGAGLGTQNPTGNILLGYRAGDNLTTGTYNIVLGYDVDAPAIGSTQTLNIGNLIYGTGLDGTGTTPSTGNIGIGTASPSFQLHVKSAGAGQIAAEGAARGDFFLIDSGAGADLKRLVIRGSDGNITFGAENDAVNNYKTTMTINSGFSGDGNVGIGTTTPQRRLSVNKGSTATTTVQIGDIYSGTGKGCFETADINGNVVSFYFVGGTQVIETNACK